MLHSESPSVVHQKCIDSLVESVVASEGIMTKDAYLKFVASRSEGLLDVESFSGVCMVTSLRIKHLVLNT